MAGLLQRLMSHGPKPKVLTEDQAARSVVVTNIPLTAAPENILIYFQRQKNGGGEIDHVHIPQKGTAVITFDSSAVADGVQERSHTLEGSKLKLQRFVPKEPPEVFQEVTARINFDKAHLSPRESKNMLEVLKDNTEVAYRKVSEGFILSGTFRQIEAAHKLLQYLVKVKGGNAAIRNCHDKAQNQQDELVNDTSNITETSCFEVQGQFMKLLQRAYKSNLRNIEEKFCVKIVWEENASQVRISPKRMPKGQNRFHEGCDAFIDLYQKFHPTMGREEVELPDEANESRVLQAISSVQNENPVIVERVKNNLVVYAEKDYISKSVYTLKEKLGLTLDSSRKTRRSHRNKNRDAYEDNETQQQGGLPLPQHLNQTLDNGVSLSLYQGDITDERVDAIVNAANEWLQHGAGVAAAIVRKGGRQIQDESNWITHRNGSLSVGGAVHTSGGSLTCRYVIHTVGPEWRKHGKENCISLLHRACKESLCLAAKLELSSIALPAISSGIFGMPKDICAQVMFKAVEDFSSSNEAEFSTLRDVRVVIIDDPTVSVFHEEFDKRYRSKEAAKSGTLTNQLRGRPSDFDRETPSTTKSRKDLGKSKGDGSFASVDQTQRKDRQPPDGQPKQNRDVESLSLGASRDNDNSDHDALSDRQPRRDQDVESRSKGAGRDDENSDQDTFPDSIKQESRSNQATENAIKASPPASAKTPKMEENRSGHTLKDTDSPPVESSNGANIRTANTMLPYGRGRGNLAVTFPRKGRSTSNGNTHLQGNTSHAGRGRGVLTTTITSPPGLTVTNEGKSLAKHFGDREKVDQETGVAEPINDKNKVEKSEPSSTTLKGVNDSQGLERNKQEIDGEDPPEGSTKGSPTDQKTSSQSHSNQDHASRNKLPSGAIMSDPDKTIEYPPERSASDDENMKRPIVENTVNVSPIDDQSEDQTNIDRQREEVPHSVTDTANDEAMSVQDPLASQNARGEMSGVIQTPTASCPHSLSDHPASPQSASEVDEVAAEERRDADGSPSQDSDSGPPPPNELHQNHKANQPGRLMCMNLNKEPVYPWQCGGNHYFCTSCIKAFIEKTGICPQCQSEGLPQGNQPTGYMTWITVAQGSLPGYEDCAIIIVYFKFDEGIQGPKHPNPGQPYSGLFVTAFLPFNADGKEVCNLLSSAFDAGLVFTIGTSPDTGEENKIVCNGIELKTNQSGGPANYGYPDPSYLDRVKSQLAKKGITKLNQ